MEGVKLDSGKPRMDLLSRAALEGCAQVLTFGARKYAAHNWRHGMAWSRLFGAAMRHLTAMMDGEDTDPESGLPHVDHLACCVMFLSEYQKRNLGKDDRWKPKNENQPRASESSPGEKTEPSQAPQSSFFQEVESSGIYALGGTLPPALQKTRKAK